MGKLREDRRTVKALCTLGRRGERAGLRISLPSMIPEPPGCPIQKQTEPPDHQPGASHAQKGGCHNI
jgi:hypothetical protein